MELIEGVKIKNLKVIPDERGYLFEILRSDEEIFEKFGQSYLTTCYPGVIKGWHYHKKQTDFFTCIKGMIKLVLYDNRVNSKTNGLINELFIGEKNLVLVKIPPLVIHGIKCIGQEMAMIINYPTIPYNHKEPDEYRIPYNSPEIPYNWDIKFI